MPRLDVMHKLLLVLSLVYFLVAPINLVSLPSNNLEDKSETLDVVQLPSYPLQLVRPIPLKVVFVGFDGDLLNLTFIEQRLRMSYWHLFVSGSVDYYIDFNFTIADEDLEEEIFDFINKIKVNDTTSDLLEDKLEDQLERVLSGELGVRMKVFENTIKGYSIDAVALEEKLASLTPNLEDFFYLYVLNLSYLDNPSSGWEHWFSLDIKDADSNRTRDFWRLEWDNSLNSPVKFPFAAFNMRQRVLFIDPTAYNWYLNWTRIWWGDIPVYPEYAMYRVDLDHYIQNLNLSDPEDVEKVNRYISNWIRDFLDDLVLVASSTQLYDGRLYTESVSVQIKVINTNPSIVTTSKYKWAVSEEKILVALKQIYPNISATFIIEFAELDDYPEVADILEENVYREEPDWTYYDGVSIYYELASRKHEYFNFSLAERNLVGWIFILYDASMVVGNREFTGLGGNGHIMIMMEAKRILGEDLNEPRQGFSLVIIHELGHAMGFLHTFSSASYASDFAFDVMGYYPGSWNYSRIRIETIHREINDDLLLIAYSAMNYIIKNVSQREDLWRFEDKILEIDYKLKQIEKLQNTTHYDEAFSEIMNVMKDIEVLKEMLATKPEESPEEDEEKQGYNLVKIVLPISAIVLIGVAAIIYIRRRT